MLGRILGRETDQESTAAALYGFIIVNRKYIAFVKRNRMLKVMNEPS